MTATNPYDRTHRKARAAALRALVDGTPCHFCGRPMTHDMNLHLDHDPHGNGYRGLAHAWCNSLDGARRGGKAYARRYGRRRYPPRQTPPPPTPPTWSSQQW